MARITKAAVHLSAEEVKQRLQTDPRPWCRQRWLIIYYNGPMISDKVLRWLKVEGEENVGHQKVIYGRV